MEGVSLSHITMLQMVEFIIFSGVLSATIILAIFCIQAHIRITNENQKLRFELADLTSVVRRNEWLLALKGQRTLIWSIDGVRKKIELLGVLPVATGAPEARSDFLSFAQWLTPESFLLLDHAITALHETGETFDLVVETNNASILAVEGFRSARYVLVRFVSLSGEKEISSHLKLENQKIKIEHDIVLSLLKKINFPFWIRHADTSLKWVNHAYAIAVECLDSETVIKEKKEFLSTRTRQKIDRWFQYNDFFDENVSTVVAGDRRIYSVSDSKRNEGSAGIAIDITEMKTAFQNLEHANADHAETLNRLTTAVVIFDISKKLRFYNEAFRSLWNLEAFFLDHAPDHALLLDRLRSEGKIAERPEWRRWKDSILSVYRSLESQEDLWHLPDGRVIRVVGSPQSNGSVTWMFENLTEKIDLEMRYNEAIRVQGETLDNLMEGVAVFGLDGKLKLFNPAFLRLWDLESAYISVDMHIAKIRDYSKNFMREPVWETLAERVTGYQDYSPDSDGETILNNGKVLRYRFVHLPNSQKMITCVDVTDSVNVERVLKEKNEALEKADKIKNDFIQHVSYELRSPLTNIMGFSDLMLMPKFGKLTKKQKEYLQYIISSSQSLNTIVDDILDLATVDAGIMKLEYHPVNIMETIAATIFRLLEKIEEKAIGLTIQCKDSPESFFADHLRITQILYNLLSNAVNYAPLGSIIELGCQGKEEGIEFFVHDQGPGIPEDVIETVFERFESITIGKQRRGAGLGLAIVKSFVELHKGKVNIQTKIGKGTTVTCFFPSSPSI